MNGKFLLGGGIALLAVVAFVLIYLGGDKVSERQADENASAVRGVLDAQVAAWNRGDLESFMDGYAREEATTFVSADRVTRGWQTVLDRYRKSYDTPDKMGALRFEELDLKPLSEFYMLATGRWQLTLDNGQTAHGRFTLLFRKTVDGWRIVHDHTSSAS
ncbi:MAG TPA: nuclear transport factor 2 family protein [Pyrinomonadaceae bacterium]|nr:nuclear transport factor 2 family protein [Pyrinomonadaceae bacterium]